METRTMSEKDAVIARALNELSMMNLSTTDSTHDVIALITDYILDGDVSSSSSSDSDKLQSGVACPEIGAMKSAVNNDTEESESDTAVYDEQFESDRPNIDNNEPAVMPEVVINEEVTDVMENVETLENQDEEMAKIKNFMCDCSKRRKKKDALVDDRSCSADIEPDFIYKCRLKMAEMDNYERDLILLRKISTMTNLSDRTQNTKRAVQTQRKHQRTEYMVEGKKVCRHTFRFIHAISQDKLTALFRWYKEHGLVPRKKRSVGRQKNCHFLSHDDICRVVTFISNFAEDNAVILPGRHPGQKKFDVKLLPSNVTKADVWRLYKSAMESAGERAVKLSSFRSLWKTLMTHIVRTKPMSDLCWVCQKNYYQVYRSANLPEVVKPAKLRKQEEHLRIVSQERSIYQDMQKTRLKTSVNSTC